MNVIQRENPRGPLVRRCVLLGCISLVGRVDLAVLLLRWSILARWDILTYCLRGHIGPDHHSGSGCVALVGWVILAGRVYVAGSRTGFGYRCRPGWPFESVWHVGYA